MTIQFFAPGTPKAQPRARAFARKMGDTYVARVYDAGTAENWKSEIAMAAREHIPARPIEGPVRLDIDVYFPRPKYMLARKYGELPIPHDSKPDRDNCEKAITDCMTALGFWVDDCQVCAGEVRKFYVGAGERAGARIELHAMKEQADVAPPAKIPAGSLFGG